MNASGQENIQLLFARRGLDGILKAVGASFVVTSLGCQKLYRTARTGVFRAPRLQAVVLSQTKIKALGNSTIICAVRTFQEIHIPDS